MFTPTTPCTIELMGDSYNLYGRAGLQAPVDTFCAIDELEEAFVQTSVRADSSGTRSYADEEIIDSKLLFPGDLILTVGSKVTVLGRELKVKKTQLWPGAHEGCVAFQSVWLSVWQSNS